MAVFSRCILLMAALLLVGGCASTPEQPSSKASNPAKTSQQQLQQLIAQADKASPPERYRLKLQAAQLAVKLRQLEQAQALLDALPARELGAESYVKRALIHSEIATQRGDYKAAKSHISGKYLVTQLTPLQGELAIQARQQRARLFFEGGDYAKAAKEQLILNRLLSQASSLEQHHNQDALWQSLMEMPPESLTRARTNSTHAEDQGWYDLALRNKQAQSPMDQQRALSSWNRQWPTHPAAKRPPGDLQQLQKQLAEQPKQIAVLLPQWGKLEPAARAISDGILAAYYRQAQDGVQLPNLQFYNTEGKSTAAVYQQAVNDGAQVVIGPLEKERVAELAQLPQLPVTTLALNTLDSPAASENLFQIGLAAEDEAKQIAEQAWRQGFRNALVLLPSNSLGDRHLNSFASSWRAQGGQVREYRYGANEDFGELTRRALQIDQSEERAKALQALVGPLDAEPSPRQDIDMIFAVVQPDAARQLKPNLHYYSAGDLPIYTTSSVYSGEKASALNQELQQIRFLTLPWYFAEQQPEKLALDAYAEKNAQLSRLNALGVDVFNLLPRLKALQKSPSTAHYGQTGKLYLNTRRQFERQQTWATFDASGRAQPLSLDDNDNTQ
jgi:uncharacterized protein